MKRYVKAVFIGPAAFDALKRGNAGRVHSVFERTFNIAIGNELVGIARSSVPRSPINLVTDIPADEDMRSLGIQKGMEVRIVDERIFIGGVLELSLKDAKLWQPKTRTERCVGRELIEQNLKLARQFAADKRERDGLGQLLPHMDEIARGAMPSASDLNRVAKAALPHLLNLVKVVQAGDIDGVRGAAKGLVGLGPGLSPSADDALAGFTAALWWTSRSLCNGIDRAKEINQAIVSRAGGTTLLSQQLLGWAAKGEVDERIQGLFEVLLGGMSQDVEVASERVLAMGETSGVDTMVGVLLGFELGLKIFSSKT